VNGTAKLKKMNPPQQIFAELLLNNAHTKGLMNSLSEETDTAEFSGLCNFSRLLLHCLQQAVIHQSHNTVEVPFNI
jgi:hypothetical protein